MSPPALTEYQLTASHFNHVAETKYAHCVFYLFDPFISKQLLVFVGGINLVFHEVFVAVLLLSATRG